VKPVRPGQSWGERIGEEVATVTVRYIVDDVDAAIDYYARHLGSGKRCIPHPRSPCFRGETSASPSARPAGVNLCNDIVEGVGGKQVLIDDPSGQPGRAVRTRR
jgi:hypothetical protein